MGSGHICPATGCTRNVPSHMLMCRAHWYMVPAPLRSAVWNAWAGGAGMLSEAHQAACDDAIEAVNAKLAASGPGWGSDA